MEHDDLYPVLVAQQMLHDGVALSEIVRRLRAAFGLSAIDAAAAGAAARVLARHTPDLTASSESARVNGETIAGDHPYPHAGQRRLPEQPSSLR